jgi:2,4-dienoyl-CoA reductase-like NADH-dependent reductase (Old Yellow Enzyme family)/thioredoxin reductase
MSAPTRHASLMSPGRIGPLELRNRIVMTPMGSNLAEADGHLGERIIRYYEERARGGAGLLIVGVGAIAWPAGACNPNQVAISDDAFLPGLCEITRRVRAHGARIAIQLQHAGKVATRDMAAGRPMLVPSLPEPKAGDLMSAMTREEAGLFTADFRQEGAGMFYHEATKEDLAEVVQQFAAAAERAQRAGFDAVELHAGHGYLLSSFISPASNQRTDEYGGGVENRSRLLAETLRACRDRVGADFPIWCRIDSTEYRIEGGIRFEDAQQTAEIAQAAGADAIHVSAYADPTSAVAFTDAPLVHKPCGFVDFAAAIKKRVEVPVIAVGRIEADEAERIVAEGRADFIAMGRKLLADPELPKKLAEGRAEDVRPCIYCYTCVGEIFFNRASRCAVNPASGKEAEFEIQPAPTAKKVLVVGGGPAGMEVARIAALRGHRVTLCEKRERLGGTAFFSSLVYPPNGKLVDYLATQVRKLPIELRLGVAVDEKLVAQIAAEVTVVATGARRERPEIPGVERPMVLSGDDLRDLITGDDPKVAREKLSLGQRALVGAGGLLGLADRPELTRHLSKHWMPVGDRVAILGGGLVGCELAEFLCERGRRVHVIEESADLAKEMAMPRRARVLHELREAGVELLRKTRCEEILDDAVILADGSGETRTLAVDSVILAIGTVENRGLADAIASLGGEVHLIGDCTGVGYLDGAFQDAARLGRAL